MSFSDKVVMITGAGGRLGRPCAMAFAQEGARLIVTDAAPDRLNATADALRAAGAKVAAIPADVRSDEEVGRVVGEGSRALGPVDVLVNFHGWVVTNYLLEIPIEDWEQTFDVNVKGTMLTCRHVARQMIDRGANGVIVNISSGASTSARVGAAHYCGSKAAVNMLTEVLAIELGPHGIRVNAIAPGLFTDEVLRRDEGDPHPYIRDMLKAIPLGRTGDPAEIAHTVLFLASPGASYIHGEILYATGGAHCGRTHMAGARGLSEHPNPRG